jgi:hypothetical protein
MHSKILVAVVAMVVLAAGFVASRAEGQAKGAVREQGSGQNVGRWQIVQGPPTGLYRTFLIDTVTGNSFIICGNKDDKIEGWCPLPIGR